jgi:hypothetical protein
VLFNNAHAARATAKVPAPGMRTTNVNMQARTMQPITALETNDAGASLCDFRAEVWRIKDHQAMLRYASLFWAYAFKTAAMSDVTRILGSIEDGEQIGRGRTKRATGSGLHFQQFKSTQCLSRFTRSPPSPSRNVYHVCVPEY